MELVFGPVPSRRLGRSLGVNNIPPPKKCSYSCIYCQIGRTWELTIERRSFHDPWSVAEAVSLKISEVGGQVDYVTFVPDGEPTLDENLGEEARRVKAVVEKPLAILTNSSLIFRDDVRSDLMAFDLVSLKMDAASKDVWRRINRPHPSLSLDEILRGARKFAGEFPGELITETMLIEKVNDDLTEIEAIADLVAELEPRKAYLAIPTRPPAESWAKPASEETIVKAYEIFKERLGSGRVELLIGYEGSGFDLGENPVENILAIASVHPIMIDYAYQALSRFREDPEKIITELVQSGLLKLVKYRGMSFLVRSWRG